MKRFGARANCSFPTAISAACLLLAMVAHHARATAAYARPLLSRTAASAASLRTLWQTPIGLTPADHDQVVNIWHVGSVVYVLTGKGYMVAINASNGTVRWTRKIAGLKPGISRPAIIGLHQIVVLSGSQAHFLDTLTGAQVQTGGLDFPPGTCPVVIPDSRLLIGSLNRSFKALSVDLPFFTEWSEDSPGDSFTSNPVVASDTVIFGSRLGYLWGRVPSDGNHGWKRTLGGSIVAPLTANNSLAFVPCTDNNLYAVDPQTGVSPWVRHLPGKLVHRAEITDKTLLIATEDAGLFGLNPANGKVLWGPVRGITRVVAVKGSTLYGCTINGNLKMMNIHSGRVIDGARLQGARYFIYNAHHSTIYVASRYGRIAAIAPRKEW